LALPERLSLYDEVRSRGYEASIIGTYNLNFHFYERVVLRRLQSSGCRHNIVLADGAQCAEALASGDFHPKLCGSAYTILPIHCASAFHPKFIMLLGRKKARLIVGSHNLTISGFGLNREIATTFDAKPEEASALIARKVWGFVNAWTEGFPREIQQVISSTERISPWLTAFDEEDPQSPLLCSLPSGPSLWNQLRPLLPQKVRRIYIISPFFDSKLAFVRTLMNELNPKECLIAVHHQSTNIPPEAKSLLKDCRFIDVTHLGEGWNSSLHAKVYGFELGNGKTIVVSGSANASDPAWIAPPSKRNAEMVAVHNDGDRMWTRLGLAQLSELPDLDEEGWKAIRLRTARAEPVRVSCETPFLATRAAEGFLVNRGFTQGVRADRILVFAKTDESIPSVETIEISGEQALCVCRDAAILDSATRLEVVHVNGLRRIALVHRIDELLDKAAGSRRQEFRRAFAGLEGDPEQLTELLKVVEKAIFDEPVSLSESSERSKANQGKKLSKPETIAEPTSLMISAKDTVHARRRQRRVFASSDLALIIDALIYRLGRGLYEESEGPAVVQPSDVDLRDEATEPPALVQIDGHVLAKLCRSKINRLFGRMVRQLELAVERGKDATTPVIQLAAVLGVVKHLRLGQSNFEWLPRGEKVVDPEHQCEFFKEASRLLYAPDCQVAAKALAEHDQCEFDELTAVRGLLAWLALDCGVDRRIPFKPLLDDPDIIRENLTQFGYFLPVISECALDSFATTMLTSVSGEQKNENRDSAAYHLRWAHDLLKVAENKQSNQSPIELGDIAVPLNMKEVPLSIVVDVQSNKLGLLDLNTGEPRYFAMGYLRRIQPLRPQ
jgi:hypothetical protein